MSVSRAKGKKKGVVEAASHDYLTLYTIEDYMNRIKNYRQLTPHNRQAIYSLKELQYNQTISEDEKRAKIKDYMDTTFELRFHDIVQNSLSVQNAVKIFPGLTSFHEIRNEFTRVTEKSVDELEGHMHRLFADYAKEQAASQREYTCTNQFCNEALQILRTKCGETPEVLAARIMLFACSQSQRKWLDVIFRVYTSNTNSSGTGRRPHPTVHVTQNPFAEGCAKVYCEDTLILNNANFYDAVFACYYLYHVFNMDYPSVDEETFQPFDNVLAVLDKQKKKGKRLQ